MNTHRLLFLFAGTMAIPCAVAQQMYKVVGPDGKVTFSDRPPALAVGKVSVMRSSVLRPLAAPPAPPAAPAHPAGVPAAAPAAVVMTPEVEEAMLSVMGQVEYTRRFYGFCSKSFSVAARAWKQRNAAPIAQQNRLLMEVASPGKRDELLGKVSAMLADENVKMATRTPAERQEWCAGAVAELDSGKSDIVQPAMMAMPIVPYRAK
jgi:hypothetical protein